MNLFVVSVRDRAADVFGQPMFVVSIGGAVRSFADEVNRVDPQNVLNRHPEDFDLYVLGSFDDNTGAFTTESPRQIAIGKDQVR